MKHAKRKFEQRVSSQQRVMFNPSVVSSAPFDQSNPHSILSSQSSLNGTAKMTKVNLPKKSSCLVLMETFNSELNSGKCLVLAVDQQSCLFTLKVF